MSYFLNRMLYIQNSMSNLLSIMLYLLSRMSNILNRLSNILNGMLYILSVMSYLINRLSNILNRMLYILTGMSNFPKIKTVPKTLRTVFAIINYVFVPAYFVKICTSTGYSHVWAPPIFSLSEILPRNHSFVPSALP